MIVGAALVLFVGVCCALQWRWFAFSRVKAKARSVSRLSRMFVLGAVGWAAAMMGAGCKTDVGDPAACRAAEAYLPTWSQEHTSAGKSAISNVRCEAFTSNVSAGSAETSIRFDEDITGMGTFHRRGTVHFKKTDSGWQVTLANIS
jgi:hypothetical protein